MSSYKLPLSVEEMQAIVNRASPHDVSPLLYLLDSCQQALGAIRDEAKGMTRCRDASEAREFARYCLGVIGQLLPDGDRK